MKLLANASYDSSQLVPLVAAGDETAFRRLFHLYWDNVYSVAFVFTHSQVVAEEIVQDVFLKIWLKRDRLAGVGNFDNFLFVVARNHIYNELRRKTGCTTPPSDVEDSSNSPEEQLLFKETTRLVADAVQALPRQQRLVFEMSRNEGLDYTSIARRMGISKLTVKSHMKQALHTIRGYLSRHNFLLAILPELGFPALVAWWY